MTGFIIGLAIFIIAVGLYFMINKTINQNTHINHVLAVCTNTLIGAIFVSAGFIILTMVWG